MPGRICSVDDELGLRVAVVDFGGVHKQICLETLPGAAPGDWILVHAGFALQRLEPEDAEERAGWFAARPEGGES